VALGGKRKLLVRGDRGASWTFGKRREEAWAGVTVS
jgi:hypothetical protein